ncbi:hypothetical protein CHU92_12105 [Flavobacterium cyanobacteriorum]|uniref:Transcription elongation factor GreA/GreB C-terminal domain-containing protein n=1 Tax=Flavobacterium cyanobacteriorum TaxID=2022802 RepID=A0A255YXZ7_9FLAO|nr:GreA/GreB family elongation factor [Flavobacterium cyanobacteriorum]OYQ34072.1 hypothetical protein CHU92_12105 [Flavobacterium cyanobacteriorum]
MQDLKHKILSYYKQQTQDRIDAFRDMIAALTEGAANDAKGSAGDKHETTLSMMHLEQEKLNAKLAEFLEQKRVLDKINPDATGERISIGSLVQANNMYLFLSAALPKITVDGITVIALSPQSPLGSALIGKQKGDTFKIGTSGYVIEAVL